MSKSVLLFGASGRMGEQIRTVLSEKTYPELQFGKGVVGDQDDSLDKENFIGFSKLEGSDFSNFDVIVDFSMPEGTKAALKIAKENKIPIIVCTTGLSAEVEAEIDDVSKIVPLIHANNTSLGVNVMMELVRKASEYLGEMFDIEIVEFHHNQKVDAPSGTAISLFDSAAQPIGLTRDNMVCDRSKDRKKRSEKEIGVAALRGGTVPGEHSVYFFGDKEEIEIRHRAGDRKIFALGALKAASWLLKSGLEPKKYSMLDVLTE